MKEFLTYKLNPADLELRFREEKLANDKIQALTIIAFVLFIIAGFVVLDFQFLQNSISLYTSITSRCFTIITLLIAAWLIHRLSVVKSFDRILLVCVIVDVFHLLIVSLVRPVDYVTLVAWDIFTIFAIYTAVPIPLHFQMIGALFLTGGSGILWLAYKAPPWETLETVAILTAYFFANIYGIFLSYRFNRSRRNQFIQLEQEQKIKRELETALAEVKVLRGIIPICSFCKKIRNDEGYYEAVEAYISRHSEADFSHTFCPECFAEHYPDFYEEMLKEKDQ